MPTPWYEHPSAQPLIEALFALDGIAAKLEPHISQLGGEDPACIIGQFSQTLVINSFGRGQRRKWSASGASATEACMNALGNIRSAWIETHVGAKWATATQADADRLMQADEETPSVDDAINAYVREHAPQAVAA